MHTSIYLFAYSFHLNDTQEIFVKQCKNIPIPREINCTCNLRPFCFTKTIPYTIRYKATSFHHYYEKLGKQNEQIG